MQKNPCRLAGIFYLDGVDVDVAVGDGVDGEGGYAAEAELIHDVFAMGDDGGEADVQFVGNLLVDKTLNNE